MSLTRDLVLIARNSREIFRLARYWTRYSNQGAVGFWGSISEKDEDSIIRLVRIANQLSGPIVEIGALFGHTTQLIATYKNPNKQLITVENFQWNPFCLPRNIHRTFLRRNLRYALHHANMRIHEGDAKSFYDIYAGERPSMVFIDADHSFEAVNTDIAFGRNHGIPIIAGDDYSAEHPGVIKAVKDHFGDSYTVNGKIWSNIELI